MSDALERELAPVAVQSARERRVITLRSRLEAELEEAEHQAWSALGRYKFQMFGYWAAIWVHLNRIGGFKRPNPFKDVVKAARTMATAA